MKKTHKQKVKMARKMRSTKEIEDGTPLFQTEAWTMRKKVRLLKEIHKK